MEPSRTAPARHRRRSHRIAGALAASLCAIGSPGPALAAEHVIQISVDGLSGILLEALVAGDGAGDFAAFARLASEGTSTYDARADYAYTVTLPNHASMITGRPVEQPAGQPNTVHHGWTSNSDPAPGETLHNGGNPNLSYVASVFDVAHDRGRTTALYASKSKFVLFEQSYDAVHGAPDTTGPDDGRDKIDRYVNGSAASMHAAFLADMASSHYAYAFVHYSTPDDTGHADGWGSEAWNDAVRTIDDQLAEILTLVESDPLLAGHTLVILTADHGGTGTGHGDETDAANYAIPFFVWGEGVQPGADLYAINPSARANPGSGRPSYTAPVQPIRNGDAANLALAALGLPAVPGSSSNAAQDLALASASVPALPALGRFALVALLSAATWRARRRAPARSLHEAHERLVFDVAPGVLAADEVRFAARRQARRAGVRQHERDAIGKPLPLAADPATLDDLGRRGPRSTTDWRRTSHSPSADQVSPQALSSRPPMARQFRASDSASPVHVRDATMCTMRR